jgi:glycosyltransferase involved in cell wall biosynthesis
MNVLYVVQHFFSRDAVRGSIRPFAVARRLTDSGHRVTLLCGTHADTPRSDDDAREAGIEVIRAPIVYQSGSYARRMAVFARYMRWAIRTARRLPRPDVVFASSTPLTVGEVGRVAAAHHRVPFVFEVRDLWPEIPIVFGALPTPLLRWGARLMARRIYGAAAEVVALSPDMARVIRDDWGVDASRLSVIPNFADTDAFATPAVEAQREAFRERMGWTGKLVAVHAGAMGRVNGLDYVLDAGKALDAAGARDVRIVLLGDGIEARRLEARARAEGIRSVSLHAPVPKRDIPLWLAAADVGLVTVAPLPLLETNSANKFFDVLAAGRPVLLNYGGWMAGVLRETGAGLSADPRSPASLAGALRALERDPAGRQAMGRAARALAESRYARDALTRELEGVLVRAVERQARVPAPAPPLAGGPRPATPA